MNILKIRDIELINKQSEEPEKDANKLQVDWDDERVQKFNNKFRDRYVHAINWMYAMPILDEFAEEPFGINNEMAIELSKELDSTTDKESVLSKYDYFSIEELGTNGLIDEARTTVINSTQKFIEFNRFSNTGDELTTEDLKNFRTWLAKTLLSILFNNDESAKNKNPKVYAMLNYYANGMNDSTIESLKLFASTGPITLYANNLQQYDANGMLVGNKCGCQTQNIAGMLPLSINTICDPETLYRKAMYLEMVKLFSDLSFWASIEDEVLIEFKKYIEGIINKNFLLETAVYASDLYDCNCLNNANTKQEVYIGYLVALVKAIDTLIPDSEGNVDYKRHALTSQQAFERWARFLYENMYWGYMS